MKEQFLINMIYKPYQPKGEGKLLPEQKVMRGVRPGS